MWGYEVQDIETGEIFFIYGYNFEDACYRNDIDPFYVEVLSREYVD